MNTENRLSVRLVPNLWEQLAPEEEKKKIAPAAVFRPLEECPAGYAIRKDSESLYLLNSKQEVALVAKTDKSKVWCRAGFLSLMTAGFNSFFPISEQQAGRILCGEKKEDVVPELGPGRKWKKPENVGHAADTPKVALYIFGDYLLVSRGTVSIDSIRLRVKIPEIALPYRIPLDPYVWRLTSDALELDAEWANEAGIEAEE